MKISNTELNEIEKAVQDLEKRTRGELVPVLLSRSTDYTELAWMLATVGGVIAALGAYLIHEVWGQGWSLTDARMTTFFFLGMIGGWLSSQVPPLARFVLGKRRLEAEVQERALAEFSRYGVMNTDDRCGVLLLVSLLEHQVVIMGDRGIHRVLGDRFWNEEVLRIVSGIREKSVSLAMVEGIERIGKLLAEHFPSNGSEKNELSDRLKTDLR